MLKILDRVHIHQERVLWFSDIYLGQTSRGMVIQFTFEEERIKKVKWLHLSTEIKKRSPKFKTIDHFSRASVIILQIFTDHSVISKQKKKWLLFSFCLLQYPTLWHSPTLLVTLKSPLGLFTPVFNLLMLDSWRESLFSLLFYVPSFYPMTFKYFNTENYSLFVCFQLSIPCLHVDI